MGGPVEAAVGRVPEEAQPTRNPPGLVAQPLVQQRPTLGVGNDRGGVVARRGLREPTMVDEVPVAAAHGGPPGAEGPAGHVAPTPHHHDGPGGLGRGRGRWHRHLERPRQDLHTEVERPVREPGLPLPRSTGVEHDHRGVVGWEGGEQALEGVGLGDVGLPTEARHPDERGVVGRLTRGGHQAERVVGALGDAPGGADAAQHVAGGPDADRGRDRDDHPTSDPRPDSSAAPCAPSSRTSPTRSPRRRPMARRPSATSRARLTMLAQWGPGPPRRSAPRTCRGVAVGGGDQRRRERGRVVGAHGHTEAMASSSSAARRS